MINVSGILVITACLLAVAVSAMGQTLEEVRVVGQRNLLNQSLLLDGDQQRMTPGKQVSLNRSVGDLIERLPGVSLNGQGGLLQSYSVRGFSRWRIRTEVDGVPIITDRRAGNSASFVPPELLATVDVARGPASSLYGSGAMGGTVSLSSIRPQHLRASLEVQDDDNALAATIGYGNAETFAGAISVRRAEKATDARGRDLNTGYEQAGVLLKTAREVDGQTVSLTWLPSYGKDIGKSNADFPERSVSDYPEEAHSLLSLQIEGKAGWLGRVYHHYQDWQSRTERIDVRTNITDYKGHTVGGLIYAATDYLTGVGRVGAEWVGRRRVKIHDSEYSPAGELELETETIDGEQDNFAAFLDHQWETGMLRYGGGLRYDHIDQEDNGRKRSDEKLNASLSAERLLGDHWTVSGQLGTGFRFPSLTELYFNGVTPRGETLGNPELKPEQSLGVQLGFGYEGQSVSASLHMYHNDLKDYIGRYRVDEERRSYRNLDRAAIWGFEAQLSWRAGKRLRHLVSYQWQRGEDRQGEWLADLNPPALRYLLTWEGQVLRIQSDLTYRSERSQFGQGEQALDSALIWNGRLIRHFGESWRGELFINNLLNELYVGTADEDSAYQPGRTVGIRVRWTGI
jgi:iron complex outermembrane receptor protein